MNKMNIKKIWSGIREIVNIRNNVSTKISQLNINGKIIETPKDNANQLNDFFVNVDPLTESSIPRSENISPNKFLKKRNQFYFFLAHVSHDEVLKIINSLQNKSAGPASIPVKLLKLIVEFLKGLYWDHLLFLIYINDLPNISKKLDLYLFAELIKS